MPPEGDGKKSTFTKEGAKQSIEFIGKKSKSMLAVRKIRNYEEDFSPKEFAVQAQDIYVKAHECLCNKEKDKLLDYVTERAYPEMIHNIDLTTIRWKFLQSLEPPRVVHARQTNLVSKENIYAQVTVRFHTQQTLAIYDRFGRLMHGSEILAKDVLEYVVFEKNITNLYGVWRLHHKIIPDWMEPRQPAYKTQRLIEEAPSEEDNKTPTSQEQAIEAVQVESSSKGTAPPAALA